MHEMTIEQAETMRHAKTVAAMQVVAGLATAITLLVAVKLGNTDLPENTKMLMLASVPALAIVIEMVFAYRYYGRTKFLRYLIVLLVLSVGSVSCIALAGMLLS